MIDLEKDIQYVKGIGPKKAYKLNKLGIFTLKDLLFYLLAVYVLNRLCS